jgi:membrane protein
MPSAWIDTCQEFARFAIYVARRFRKDSALNMASSLSYTSLLSLVPLLAIGLAILAAFPALNLERTKLEDSLFHSLVPQVGAQVQDYVNSFLHNAGKLTAAGVVGLAFTAVMLLVTIEVSLNFIFRVATARPPISRLLVYWTLLTLSPLLFGASFSLSAWIYTVSDWAARAGLSVLTRLLALAAPTVLLMVAFAFLYGIVPHRRIAPSDALGGGLAAGLLFGALRWGFGFYLANSHSYQSIYGAVAIVPIFLLWMYLSWAVVLFGAELTAALPEWRLYRPDIAGPLPARRRLALALSLLATLFADAQKGAKGRTRMELLDVAGESEHALQAVVDRLCYAGYLAVTVEQRYVLGRDMAAVSLADLVHVLDLGLGRIEAEDCAEPWMQPIARHLAAAAQSEGEALSIPVRAALEEAMQHHAPRSTAERPETGRAA